MPIYLRINLKRRGSSPSSRPEGGVGEARLLFLLQREGD